MSLLSSCDDMEVMCVLIPQTWTVCLVLSSGGLQWWGCNRNEKERFVWCEGKLSFPFIHWVSSFLSRAVLLASSLQTACSVSQSSAADVKHTTWDEKHLRDTSPLNEKGKCLNISQREVSRTWPWLRQKHTFTAVGSVCLLHLMLG